jgi:acetylornithine deacetylase
LSMSNELHILQQEAIELLKQLIATPSFSKQEDNSSALIKKFLEKHFGKTEQHLYNVWAKNKYFDPGKPTILLNSHHDTVKPNKGYTLDPFSPIEKDALDDPRLNDSVGQAVGRRRLFGLGSNDAGGSLVSLIATFLSYYERENLMYNIILAATAEEEISGHNGIEALLPLLGKIDSAIVGEPTQMQMAVAEKGLMVLDCTATGRAGHAAREKVRMRFIKR